MLFRTIIVILCFLPLSVLAQDNAQDWTAIDRIGLYNTSAEGQLQPNIWQGYSQREALEALNRLPPHLSGNVYRTIVKRLLLSSSAPSDEQVDSPALLTKRIQLLIRYGLIEEAKALFESIPVSYDISNDMELALVKLQLSLLDGELAPACLDIQASSAQFRDMPAWRELTEFCRYRFGNVDSINMGDIQFKYFSGLKSLLIGVEPNYQKLGATEIMLAAADEKLFVDSAYKEQARYLPSLSDIIVYMGSDAKYNRKDLYQCYVIEAVKRGVRNADFLTKSYAAFSFSEEMLEGNSGQVTLHPCNIPAFFYQKIAKTAGSENRNRLINGLLDVAESMPASALVPFHEYIVEADIEKNNQWLASIISMMAESALPDSYLPVALPLKNIESTSKMSEKEYINWLNVRFHQEILDSNNVDIAAPLHFLQILNGEINKLEKPRNLPLYENIFSLTYEKKSLSLGLGFNGFIAETYKNEDQVAVLTRTIGLMGNQYVSDYSLNDVAVILSALKAYKLEKEGVQLVLEYLQ